MTNKKVKKLRFSSCQACQVQSSSKDKDKGNCLIPVNICPTFDMNLSAASFSLVENYGSFSSRKQKGMSKM